MRLKHKDISFRFFSESDASVLTELGDFSPCCKSTCQVAAASLSESRCPWKRGPSHLFSDENSFHLEFLCGRWQRTWLPYTEDSSWKPHLPEAPAMPLSWPSGICEYKIDINAHAHTSWMEHNYHHVENDSWGSHYESPYPYLPQELMSCYNASMIYAIWGVNLKFFPNKKFKEKPEKSFPPTS